MRLVSSAAQVRQNIATLENELAKAPELSERFGFVHVWYIDAGIPDEPKFGFSKFIGYEGLDAATYLKNYAEMDGRNTEWAMRDFAHEIKPETPAFRAYMSQLRDWLAGFGKTPRKTVRLMVLDEAQMDPVETPAEDRRLFDLLLAVAETLPLQQKMELRSRL